MRLVTSQVPDGVTLSSNMSDMQLGDAPDCPSNPNLPLQLCFWPIFILTILAYLMINIALVILIVFNFSFAILIKLKFCIGLGGNAQ